MQPLTNAGRNNWQVFDAAGKAAKLITNEAESEGPDGS
jgi:hypothetical protein